MSGIFLTLLATINNVLQIRKGPIAGQPMSEVGFGG